MPKKPVEEEQFLDPEKPSIDERIEELKKKDISKSDMTVILYNEGYNTQEIMRRHLPLKALKKKPADDSSVQGAIAGTTKGPGYLDEFKTMIQRQIARNRELTEIFGDIGMGAVLAALRKSGMKIADFRAIALQRESLKTALEAAGDTIFKALEYYESDKILAVEAERDEARGYASYMEAAMEQLDPKMRMEKMIQLYLLRADVQPEVLMSMIDRWLALEMPTVAEVLTQ